MSVLPGASAPRTESALARFHTGPDLSGVWGRVGWFPTVICHAGGWAPQAPTLLNVVRKPGL